MLDTSLLTRTALPPENFSDHEIIAIDHHEILPLAIDGYRDETAASTTQIITQIAQELHWSVTPDAATALLLGLYTDTGGFIHTNTTASVFQTAAYLLTQGAQQSVITQKVFGNYSLDYIHTLGQ